MVCLSLPLADLKISDHEIWIQRLQIISEKRELGDRIS